MYKFYYLISMVFLCLFSSVNANAFIIYVRNLTGVNISIDVSGETTIYEIKEKIFQKKKIPISDQAVIFAGKTLLDNQTTDEIGAHQSSTLHLVISLSAIKNQKYGEIYAERLRDRRALLDSLAIPDSTVNLDDYFINIQIFIMELEGLFKYDLPAGFIMEVGSRLNTLMPHLLAENFFENSNELMTKAIEYLNEYSILDLEKEVDSWINDQKILKNYLLCSLAYNFVLFKMLQDENIYSMEERFFSYENRRNFTQLYEEKDIKPGFAVFAEKFKKAHEG